MLRFDHPHLLWLALLILPLIAYGWRAMAGMDRWRRALALMLRGLLVAAMAFMLAGPRRVQEHDDLTVIGLLDISGSVQRFADLPPISTGDEADPVVRRSNIEYLRRWFRAATDTRTPDDRFGLVVFDGRAIAVSAPSRGDYVDDNLDQPLAEGTNIADAVRLGLAMFPADTARRLVLVTDGNETAGDVFEAVQQAGGVNRGFGIPAEEARDDANRSREATEHRGGSVIPIDVLPIAYNVQGDVQVLRIEAPPGALAGQTVTARVVLQAASPASGVLTLRREDEEVDLNGSAPGTARRIDVPEGQSVQLAQVTLGQTPINRFEAIFEADDPASDMLPDNNRAQSFTATPSKGSALIVDARRGQANPLADILQAADIPVSVQPPEQLPRDLLSFQNHDLIILDNIGAAEIPAAQRELLARYVNDLGGGVIMVGGENSFGAGGWNNTPVEDIMPVEMDPSRELRLPSAALVLVLDKSGSMNQPVAGARRSQQQIANEAAALAIESLRSDSLVGVVTFDMFPTVVIPLQPNDNPARLSAQVRGIRAEGGTNMPPALRSAYSMLKDAKAEKKRIVCMTDGRSHSTNFEEIAARLKAENIQLSTIAVGDDADEETLQRLAEEGGGEFYAVRDPRSLPEVLVDSVQVINKPLLKDVPFKPQVLPTGLTLTAGMDQSPILNGLVITSPRADPKVALEMITADGEPLLAHWQVGLGRAAAFTSTSPRANSWAAGWRDWPTAQAFWTQLARMIARPPMNTDAELLTAIDGDSLHITYEIARPAQRSAGVTSLPAATGPDAPALDLRMLDHLSVAGSIYQPDGSMRTVRLQQTAPGRYETTIDAPLSGNYIVALNPRQGTRQLSPAIGGTSKPTSPEFRRYRSNIGILDEIAAATGGRRLDIDNPSRVDLFDRAGLPRSESSLPIHGSILWWTITLLLLDVACRRLAWDVPLLQRGVASALARITPARVRGRRAAQTLATLRRVSETVEQQQESLAAGVKRLHATGRIAPPPERIIRSDGTSTAAEAEPARQEMPQPSSAARIAEALDTLRGERARSADQGAASAHASVPDATPTSADTPSDMPSAAETTAALLAAKRRARESMRKERSGPPESG